MGSRCRITVYAEDEELAAAACRAAFERISELNAVLSDYSEDSEASRVMRLEPGAWHPISADLMTALRRSFAVTRATGGAFDPTVGALTSLWRDASRSGDMPSDDVIADARHRSGADLLDIREDPPSIRFDRDGIRLDFGGIGKGISTDEALLVLASRGFRCALIDFGGDVRAGDAPPQSPAGWSVSVRDGMGIDRRVTLANAAIATSGDTERRLVIDGTVYSHVLDPRAGFGITNRVAATVIATTGWKADALASAACVLGPAGATDLRKRFPGSTIWIGTDR